MRFGRAYKASYSSPNMISLLRECHVTFRIAMTRRQLNKYSRTQSAARHDHKIEIAKLCGWGGGGGEHVSSSERLCFDKVFTPYYGETDGVGAMSKMYLPLSLSLFYCTPNMVRYNSLKNLENLRHDIKTASRLDFCPPQLPARRSSYYNSALKALCC